MIGVTLLLHDPEGETNAIDKVNVDDVEFISLVNGGTYGPPALIAPSRGEPPVAKVGESVLFINTSCPYLVGFEAERVSDR